MLELREIIKDYVSGDNVTHALKGINVSFRRNEFVSILGASGCGKTTLLNIIGGLDRYTSGDLLILGKSTKDFKDRDWDTYRNHSIGFVFQTYNLIAHQNILKNVELALTISGVSKEERRRRAYDVLKVVGLEGMEKKKPNQLSGGQCQRVAIARALINNPEILLADEPTGALDSETSIQIMDLLKEVASDRLVIMVTHNPELAEKYSTRIINMSDGLLVKDSNPFDGVETEKIAENPENSQEKPEISKGKKKKTSMSIWTSMGLSTSNLLSKLKRTILVTIAGSIGIIGVSAVLAASRGVKDYINDMQNDMLSAYPISIAEESVDYTSLITGLSKNEKKDAFQFDPKDPKVGVDSMIAYLMEKYSDFTNVKTNTIDEKLLSFIAQAPQEHIGVTTYNYGIDPTNNIFGAWKDQNGDEQYISFNGLTQRYIAELKTVADFSQYASFVNLFTSFMDEVPDNKEYILDQYDVIAGDGLSLDEDSLVLVVDKNTTLTDLVLGQTGVFDHDSFINIALCAVYEQAAKNDPDFHNLPEDAQNSIINGIREKYPYKRDFTYDELLNRDYYYFPQETIYGNDGTKVISDDEKRFIFNFIDVDSSSLNRFATLEYQNFAGFNLFYGTQVVRDDENGYGTNTIACFNISDLLSQLVSGETKKDIETIADFAGMWVAFSVEELRKLDTGDLMSLLDGVVEKNEFSFIIDEHVLAGDDDSVVLKKITGWDFDEETFIHFDLDPTPICQATPEWDTKINTITGYSYNAVADNDWIKNPTADNRKGMKMKISAILRLKENKNFGSLSRGIYYSKAFADNRYVADSVEAPVTTALKNHIAKKSTHQEEFNKAFVTFDYKDFTEGLPEEEIMKSGYASSLNGDLSSSISSLFSSISGVDYAETNAVHLRALCGDKTIDLDDDPLVAATFKHLPKEIDIYPKSFEGKEKVVEHLDRWNSDEVLTIDGVQYERKDRDELTYTDTISLIISVIDTFIDAITVALIIFTSLSLVVSCFMIAVITYISVVERIKEIGVIRSLGGRKGDVAGLFIMENFMTGLFSGVFGVTITYILQIILNIILKYAFGLAIIHLTFKAALLMIAISISLSVLSGLIPSQSAARKDPVVALRSNE